MGNLKSLEKGSYRYTWMCLAPVIFLLLSLAPVAGEKSALHPDSLRFPPSGPFTILQYTDIQDADPIDPRTLRFMSLALDEVNPDLVVVTGDLVDGRCRTPGQVERTVKNIAAPMISHEVPWLVTLGNHDEDHSEITGVRAKDILSMCMSLPLNMNSVTPPGVTGYGIAALPVYDTRGDRPLLMIWCLDSGRYAPQEPLPVPPGHKPEYAWIGTDQVNWYTHQSENLGKRWNRKVPGVMFFHVPIHEFDEMWSQPWIWPVEGEKNEEVSAGYLKSSLFSAVLARGDVRGIFVGHDHVNNFHGIYHGVLLAYGASCGFGTYGLANEDAHRLRGARIIKIYPEGNGFPETGMIYASELGIR